MNPKKQFAIVLGALLAIALTYYLLSTDRNPDMVLIGTVDANQVIVSSKVVGRLETLNVDEGQDVKAGELVATIDSAEFEAQRRAAQATLASLRTRVAATSATAASTQGDTANQVGQRAGHAARRAGHAESRHCQPRSAGSRHTAGPWPWPIRESCRSRTAIARSTPCARSRRKCKLLPIRSAPPKRLCKRPSPARIREPRRCSTVSDTREQAANAQAQLAQAEVQLGYTKIFAPISGKVNVRAARQGEVVNVGTPIVTIVDLTQTWVYAAVPETYADAIKLGDTLTVRMPSGARLPGKVIAKAAEGDFATQRDVSRRKRDIKTVQIKLLIDNPGMQYVPGMTAEVLLPKSKIKD